MQCCKHAAAYAGPDAVSSTHSLFVLSSPARLHATCPGKLLTAVAEMKAATALATGQQRAAGVLHHQC
jgi:hypothetical protein